MTADVGRSITAAGTTFAYRESGSGPLALLLHGFGMDSRMWRPVMERLGAHRRCVAVDMRGAGATPAPADGAMPLERHAEDLAALVAAFGAERADVVGFSMGGFVLLALLEVNPSVVASATFVGTRANADDETARAGRDALIATLLDRGRGAGFLQMAPKLVAAGASLQTRALLRTMFEEQPYEGLVSALIAMRDRPDRLGVVTQVNAPTLVVAGDQDAFAPLPLTTAVAEAAPQGRVEIVAGVGHTVPLEAPGRVAALLDSFWL